MNEILGRFNGDINTKEALQEYFRAFFKQEIINRSLKKENTDSLADAINEMDRAFEKLSDDYGIKQEQSTNKNEAR